MRGLPITISLLSISLPGHEINAASFLPTTTLSSRTTKKKSVNPMFGANYRSSSLSVISSEVVSDVPQKLTFIEPLSDLAKESLFCLRSANDSSCTVECKRIDGKPLGFGLVDEDDLDTFTRRAFAFTRESIHYPPGSSYPGPCMVHIREIPFSYGKLGGSVWHAAVAFGQYVASNASSLIQNKRVLELGAGVGIPGLVAAQCGAKSVTVSEFGFEGEVDGPIIEGEGDDSKRLIPSALLSNLKYNVHINGLEDQVSVRNIDWYDYVPESNNKNPSHEDDDTYDIIIGSDLVNWEDDVGPLISTLKYFLSKGAKAVLSLSNENRKALPQFLELIQGEFTTVEIKEQSVVYYDEHPLLLITLSM